jgi:hypothetical protein
MPNDTKVLKLPEKRKKKNTNCNIVKAEKQNPSTTWKYRVTSCPTSIPLLEIKSSLSCLQSPFIGILSRPFQHVFP